MTQIVSSISGLPIYSPSAAYAPTNGSDVSAIASGYQVVSATATQLYAGTSYLTSVNEAPISASRAGNAANASMANSAYYDGTGRLISALPDSAAVSSIASSYAESAASGKQDSSGMSAYAYESSNSAKLDATAFSTVSSTFLTSQTVTALGDDGTYITSINGSALSGVGGGGTSPVTSIESAKLSVRTGGIGSTATAAITAISGENGSAFATRYILPNATQVTGSNILAFSPDASMWSTAGAATGVFAPLQYGTGAGLFMNVGSFKGYIKGNEYFVSDDRYGYIRGESHNSRGNRVVAQSTSSASAEIYAKGDTAEIHLGTTNGTAKIDTADINNWNSTYNTVSSNSASWGAGASEATVSSIASSYAESAVSSKLDASASSSFYTTANESGFITGVDLSPYQTTADMSSYIPTSMSSDFQQVTGMSSYVPYSSIGYNTASAISGINGSALAGTTYSAGTGIDITDDVISVETPVDIVAGPGIVIDNPDGNTLRVSMAADYETVLWETTSADVGTVAPIALSESIYNFEKIKIVGRLNGNNHIGAPMSWEWYTTDIPVGSYLNCFGLPLNDFDNFSLGIYLRNSVECVSANNSLTHTKTYSWSLNGTTLTNQTTDVWGQLRYFRVVGINRISGGN